MIVVYVPESDTSCIRQNLPYSDMVVDPRGMGKLFTTKLRVGRKFEFTVVGTVLIVQRTDMSGGWLYPFKLRVYDPATDLVPDFKSTTYTYLGVVGEQAPRDTIIGIIHPTVKTIKKMAFKDCVRMKKCTMEDIVQEIGTQAFQNCRGMRVIHISRKLRRIGCRAFAGCSSIDALVFGASLTSIGRGAFDDCYALRILQFSSTTISSYNDIFDLDESTDDNAKGIISGCNALKELYTHHHEQSRSRQLIRLGCIFRMKKKNEDRIKDVHVLKWLSTRHDRLPLHKMCLDPSVTIQKFENFLQTFGTSAASQIDDTSMVPLHILVMNPHASPGMMEMCFQADPMALITQDDRGKNPVDYLWRYSNVEGLVCLVQALSIYRQQGLSSTSTCNNQDHQSHVICKLKLH